MRAWCALFFSLPKEFKLLITPGEEHSIFLLAALEILQERQKEKKGVGVGGGRREPEVDACSQSMRKCH